MPERNSQSPVKRWPWLDEVMRSQMTAGVKIAAFAIASRVGDDYAGCCFEKYANIAKRCNMTERGIRAAVAALIDAGFLTAKKWKFGGTNKLKLALPASLQQSVMSVPDSNQSVTAMTDSDTSNPSQQCQSIRHGDAGQSGTAMPVELKKEPSTELKTEEKEDSEKEGIRNKIQKRSAIDEQTEVRFTGIKYPAGSAEEWPSEIISPGYGGDASAKIRISRHAADFLGYVWNPSIKAPRWPDGRYADEAVLDAIPPPALGEMIQRCKANKLTKGDLFRAIVALGIPKAADHQKLGEPQ